MRVKVLLEIDKPLHRWMKLAMGHGGMELASIKYERLMDFCFNCGRLGHVEKDCQYEIEKDGEVSEVIFQYDPYLRASPKKRSLIHKGVREKDKVLLANLKTNKNATTSVLQHSRAVAQGPSSAARKRLFSTPSAKAVPNVPPPVAISASISARQPSVLTAALPCTLRPNEEVAHAKVKSSPGVDNVAESLASLATTSDAEVCKDSSLGKCPAVVNDQEHDVSISASSTGKTWRRYNRGTIDDKGGSGNRDIVFMHVGGQKGY
ncbi:Intracisternal A-particle Gag-related polyprotein [Bienertia sinuspersici]